MGHPRPIAPVKAATKMSVRALREPTNPADVIGASRFVQPIRHPESSPGQHKRIILLFDSCITNLIRDAFPVQWDERIGKPQARSQSLSRRCPRLLRTWSTPLGWVVHHSVSKAPY